MAKRNQYAQQAADLALVRYGPEFSALAALLKDAQQTRNKGLTQATNARQRTVRAVYDARPQVEHAYEAAGAAVSPAFVGGGGIEASALTARLGESGALARSQLEDRRVAAVQGEGAQRAQVRREFGVSKGKITDRGADLLREQGAFTSSTISDLVGADAKARAEANRQAATLINSRGNALISAGLMPTYDKHGNITGATPIPGGRLDPNAPQNQPKTPAGTQPKWATPTAQAKSFSTLRTALSEAKSLRADDPGATRQQVAQLLLQGADDVPDRRVPVYDSNGKKKLNPDGTAVMKTVPGVKGVEQVKDALMVRAALDIEFYGHLTPATQRLLHKNRIKIGPLGVKTYGQHLKDLANRPTGRVTPLAPGPNGQMRPT